MDIFQTALVSIIPPTLHFGMSKAKFAEKNPNTLAALTELIDYLNEIPEEDEEEIENANHPCPP